MIPMMICPQNAVRGKELRCVELHCLIRIATHFDLLSVNDVKAMFILKSQILSEHFSECMWMCVAARNNKVSKISVMARLVLFLLLVCGCQHR